MNRHMSPIAGIAALLSLSGCGDSVAPTVSEDPAKLSEELETEARAIEARAAEAVKQAEQDAQAELDAVSAEAAAASAPESAEAPEPDTE
jgi:hypothetical protein